MTNPVDDIIAAAALSDSVLFADRAEMAWEQGEADKANKLILEALMAYNKATLWQPDRDENRTAFDHIKRIASLVGLVTYG